MSVVVTGAAGFIGRHLVSALAARGYDVVGIDRRTGVPAAANAIVAELTAGDATVAAALREADAVFHLAAFPGVRQHGAAADAQRHRDNILATRTVLAAVPLDVPLVVTSSSSVYGGAAHGACSERDALAPRGAYAASKVDVERMCAHRVSAGGWVAVARPFTVGGEGQRPDMAIARWIAAAAAGQPMTILGSADRRRDITDVRDVVEGLIRMAERNVRSTVNLGTGTAHRLGEITAAVAAAFGTAPRTTVEPAAAVEPEATLADTTRCTRLLGFTPTTDLAALIRRQVLATAPLALAGAAT